MFLVSRPNTLGNPPTLNLAAGANLGAILKLAIDRSFPLERIDIAVSFNVTTALVMAPATAQTTDAYDNILQLLQHINLSVPTASQPRNVVDCRGAALLEYNARTGLNLDAPTLELVASSQTTGLATGCYRMTYSIPLAPNRMADPLRTRLLLPVHQTNQDPVLTLTFNSLAGMGMTAGVFGQIYVEVGLVRRAPTALSEAQLAKTAIVGGALDANGAATGYINFDLLEQPWNIAPGLGGTSVPQRFPLALNGEYTEFCYMHYLGGANITRSVIDASGAGDTVAHGFGSESIWQLQTAQVPIRTWKWHQLQFQSDRRNPRTRANQTYAPNFGGPVFANTNFQPGSSTVDNFLDDGVNTDDCNELGSLVDANLQGTLKLELVGYVANVATNGTTLYVMGRRLFGDLGRWQAVS